MKAIRAVDAFCGAGGLSIGLSQVGFEILLGFDHDEKCVKTLQTNQKLIRHPVLKSDIRDMLNGALLKMVDLNKGDLELLAGGPPCQGFSVQRTVGGDQDERNLLVDDYGDLIAEVFPHFFLMENVPGIGGKRGRAIVDRFLQRMSSIGYFCHEKILDAQDYGVPQRRRRFLIVGERVARQGPFFEWPVSQPDAATTVRSVIGHLPPPPLDGADHPSFFGHRADRLSELNKMRLSSLQEGQARDALPQKLLANCHKLSSDQIGHRNVYGRMSWDDVAPTITARFDSFTRGKFGHPEQLRSISLLEGALLQTFPKNFRFSGNKVDIARQIGNAVPPKFAAAIGRAILRALKMHAGDRP
jgi:DNA (cytosine-5)-methyltransferase 1